MVKNLPAVRESRVRSLCQEDPLEKGMATYSSILAWKIPWILGIRTLVGLLKPPLIRVLAGVRMNTHPDGLTKSLLTV